MDRYVGMIVCFRPPKISSEAGIVRSIKSSAFNFLQQGTYSPYIISGKHLPRTCYTKWCHCENHSQDEPLAYLLLSFLFHERTEQLAKTQEQKAIDLRALHCKVLHEWQPVEGLRRR